MSKSKGKYFVKRLMIALVSTVMIAGFVALFIAASKDRSKSACKALVIHVKNNNAKIFVDKAAIESSIINDKSLNPVGKQLNGLNIQLLERSVKTFPWVKEAEIYIDNDNILQINITERVPLARVFTTNGNSFYIDNEGTALPVNGSFSIKMPVFTGFPNDTPVVHDAKDSLLLTQMILLSEYITGHPFWRAQVAQMNINSSHQFELIPTVGSTLIEFGHGNNIQEKFDKLLVFYQKGLNNVGWGYYDTLDLQYKGQIVATRRYKSENPVVDSLLTQNLYQYMKDESPEITTK
jgi:cell division protein FtsQ